MKTAFKIFKSRQRLFSIFKIKSVIALASFVLCFNTIATAQLKLSVITSSPEGFWVNSTLLTGEKEALLIDAQFSLSDAHRLVARLLENKVNLTTIYITHSHPDHYFGLIVLKQAFPDVRILALPSVVADIKRTWEAKVAIWKPLYGNNVTSNPIFPESMDSSTLLLEGNELKITGNLQGDEMNSSFVWIPSLKAAVCGDIVYNGVYPWTMETTPAQRKDWIATLNKIAELKPLIVVGGHKNPKLKDDAATIEFTKNYLTFYDRELPKSKSSEEFQSKVKTKFPGLGLDIILKLAADAAFTKNK